MNNTHSLLRVRVGHEHSRVTSIELFFDLVFVFAVTQLSHSLAGHFTLAYAINMLLLILAVWWVWMYTTWATNWLDPENLLVRLLLLALMLAGLLLSSSIPKAFESRGLAFAAAYVFMQVGRTAFVVWCFKEHPAQYRNFQRVLTWLVISAFFWLAGALVESGTRLALWAFALFLEYLGPPVRFWTPHLGRSAISDWNIEGAHMAERCGLFVIIALGESILVTGATFSALEWTPATVAAFISSFIGSVVLWWLYFDLSAGAASEAIASSHDPGRLGRSAYTYSHLLIVMGIILSAVADEFVLAHPTGHTETNTMIAVVGGPVLYLIGNSLFKWAIWRRLRTAHLIGIPLLLLLVPVANFVSPLALVMATTLVLIGIAVWEWRMYRLLPQSHLMPANIHPEQVQ
jgi:low temperature requirement protein LtrA